MNENRLFLKLFFISLFLHIIILPLFSLVLPSKKPSFAPIEVIFFKKAEPKKVKLTETKPLPEIPKIPYSIEKEKIFSIKENDIFRKVIKETIGIREHSLLTMVYKDIPKQEFPIEFPSVANLSKGDTNTFGKFGYSEEIIGPGGERKIIYREKIPYPEWAKKKRIECNIRIKFYVSPEGKITDTEIITSSGYPELDVMVEDAFRRWVFEPQKVGTKVWGEIVFKMRLK